MILSSSCCRFVGCTSMMRISRSTSSQRCSIGNLIYFLFRYATNPTATECHGWNRDSSDQATFFQSSIVQFWWACVNCSLSFLLFAERVSPGVLFCCCSPSSSRFHVWCVQRWYSAFHWLERVLIWVTVAFLSSGTSLPILLWPLTSTRHFRPHNCHALDIFSFGPFSVNSKDGWAWKSQRISSFWNTQSGPSGTNNHATFKVT